MTRLSGALTFCLYAISWIFITETYASFNVDPPDIGITLEWLLVKAISAAIILCIVSLILTIFPVISSFRDEAIATGWLTGAAAVTVAGSDLSLAVFRSVSVFHIALLGLLSVLSASLVIGLASRVPVVRRMRKTLGAKKFVSASMLVILAAATAFLPWLGSSVMVEKIRAGQAVSVDFGIGLTLISFDRVQLTASPGSSAQVFDNECFTLLGASNSVYYLYDSRRRTTIHIPINFVTLANTDSC